MNNENINDYLSLNDENFSIILEKADRGDCKSQLDIARRYENNDFPEKAFEYYEKAANQGNAEAQFELGECFFYGYGTDTDYTEAFKMYEEAAENGIDIALYKLGICYMNGYGVTVDKTAGLRFWNLMIENEIHNNENPTSPVYKHVPTSQTILKLYLLGCCYDKSSDSHEAKEKAFECFIKAADDGFPFAQIEVARYYEDGIVVNSNKIIAYEYYRKAFSMLNGLDDYEDIIDDRSNAESGRDRCSEYLRYSN